VGNDGNISYILLSHVFLLLCNCLSSNIPTVKKQAVKIKVKGDKRPLSSLSLPVF
jgi:hypothetical protein